METNKSLIVKFPAYTDPINSGEMEYHYSLCAKKCGITMTETKLFPSEKCHGNGINPGKKELLAVGHAAGMPRRKCEQIADEIYKITTTELAQYLG